MRAEEAMISRDVAHKSTTIVIVVVSRKDFLENVDAVVYKYGRKHGSQLVPQKGFAGEPFFWRH
jgi:hypothetical protein